MHAFVFTNGQTFEPQPGSYILDVGCGCGLDSQIAAMYAGSAGRVRGVDLFDRAEGTEGSARDPSEVSGRGVSSHRPDPARATLRAPVGC